MARKQHSGEFQARPVGGTAIACRTTMAHSLQARPPELPDDKNVQEYVASQGLDWAAAIVRTTNLRFSVISVYLRPSQLQDHATTMQEIRRFIMYTNIPFIIAGDFNASPETLAGGGLLSGLKGHILIPRGDDGGRTTTCHQRASATLIDYCFIDERIIGACKLVVTSTPWATHEGLLLTVSAKWSDLVARTVLGPRPFPFEADTMAPKKETKNVLGMSEE